VIEHIYKCVCWYSLMHGYEQKEVR